MNGLQIIERSDEQLPYNLLLLADPSKDMINKYISNSTLFLAQQKGQTIGVLALITLAREAEIMNVSVDERYHARGVGSQLINHAIEHAKKYGYQKIVIGTADTSTSQQKLYQKLGFKIAGKIKNFFVDHYQDAILENGIHAKDMIRLEMVLT